MRDSRDQHTERGGLLVALDLVLLSPKMTLAVDFLGVFMLLVLSIKLFQTAFAFNRSWMWDKRIAACFMIIGILAFGAQKVEAGFPTPELLEELKTKLMPLPECLPDCAQIQKMALEIVW